MSEIPSILLVDDGELDRVERLLVQAGFDPERMRASRVRTSIEKPRDLLVMSWHPTRELPALHDNPEGAEPTRVCLHSQDFLPLRERLRQLGVDYLVQTALDDDSLRLFLLSQLYRGPERRDELRLPLGGMVTLRAGGASERVKLAELSRAMCRLISFQPCEVETPVTVVLPKGLGGDDELALAGEVIRSGPAESRGSRACFSSVVRFGALSEAERAQLDRIVSGAQIGTRATPLQPETRAASRAAPAPDASAPDAPADAGDASAPDDAPADASDAPAPEDARLRVREVDPAVNERRGAPRAGYERRVALLDVEGAGASGLVLGRDLSMTGVCLTGAPQLAPGTGVTLALYGEARTEPVVVEAEVVRASGDELGLRLVALRDAQRAGLERLLRGPAMVECLRDAPGAGRRVVGRVLSASR